MDLEIIIVVHVIFQLSSRRTHQLGKLESREPRRDRHGSASIDLHGGSKVHLHADHVSLESFLLLLQFGSYLLLKEVLHLLQVSWHRSCGER